MPLNRIQGEHIEGLGEKYRVVPNCKWRETPQFEEAAKAAEQAFLNSGVLWPVSFDDDEVLTQEYPEERILAFIFLKNIRGVESLYPYPRRLPGSLVRELRVNGKWDDTPIN